MWALLESKRCLPTRSRKSKMCSLSDIKLKLLALISGIFFIQSHSQIVRSIDALVLSMIFWTLELLHWAMSYAANSVMAAETFCASSWRSQPTYPILSCCYCWFLTLVKVKVVNFSRYSWQETSLPKESLKSQGMLLGWNGHTWTFLGKRLSSLGMSWYSTMMTLKTLRLSRCFLTSWKSIMLKQVGSSSFLWMSSTPLRMKMTQSSLQMGLGRQIWQGLASTKEGVQLSSTLRLMYWLADIFLLAWYFLRERMAFWMSSGSCLMMNCAWRWYFLILRLDSFSICFFFLGTRWKALSFLLLSRFLLTAWLSFSSFHFLIFFDLLSKAITTLNIYRNSMLAFLLLSLTSLQALAQVLRCKESTNNATFQRGDYIPVCVHFVNEAAKTGMRLAFEVKVDEYTALESQYVFQQMYNDNIYNMSIAVQAYTDNLTSVTIPYRRDSQIFPIVSIVIVLNAGTITELVWDNGCWGGTENCDTYTVGEFTESNNYIELCPTAEPAKCDPKIYVSFIGSDRNGNFMESAGKRISQFRQYSIGEVYSSAKNTFKDYSEKVS